MTTLPDQTPPDQPPRERDWQLLDDLLTSLRESLRIVERQGPTRDLVAGIDQTIRDIAVSAATANARARIGELALAARRACGTQSLSIRRDQILLAREALARIDLVVITNRLGLPAPAGGW